VRSLFNARSETSRAHRLSFVLIGSVAPGDLIRDATRTPFNIGSGVALTDFTEENASHLPLVLCATPEEGKKLLGRIFSWTDGHPYLTQRLCMEATSNGTADEVDVDALVQRTFLIPGDKKDSNLEWIRDMLTERATDPERILTIWRELIHDRRVQDEEASVAKSHLKLTGVVRTHKGRLISRNRIYRTAFDDAWILRHLPKDLERQRRLARYRRWIFITASVAAMLAVIGVGMASLLIRARVAEGDATTAKTVATKSATRPKWPRTRLTSKS